MRLRQQQPAPAASTATTALPPPRMFCEPRNTQEMDAVLHHYKQVVERQRGLVCGLLRESQ